MRIPDSRNDNLCTKLLEAQTLFTAVQIHVTIFNRSKKDNLSCPFNSTRNEFDTRIKGKLNELGWQNRKPNNGLRRI